MGSLWWGLDCAKFGRYKRAEMEGLREMVMSLNETWVVGSGRDDEGTNGDANIRSTVPSL